MGSTDGLGDFRIDACGRRCRACVPQPTITPELIAQHQLTPAEYQKIVCHAGPRTELHRTRHLQRDVERALLLQKLAHPPEEAADAAASTWCRGRARTPASSISAAAGSSRSRSNRTTTPASSSRSRARRPASAAFCATSSRWARGRSRCWIRCASAPGSTRSRAARNRRILSGVVSGIAHYGNCFGVPTVGGECIFEACYDGNPLVNVFALGVCRKKTRFFTPRPRASAIP